MSIDEVRAFWDNRVCNINHSQKEIGTKDYFNEVEAKKYHVEPHILTFSEFDKFTNKRVLDLGCSMGTMLISFARAGAIVTGVDLSSVSLDLCRKRLDVFGLKADLYCGNAEELDTFLPVEKYDLIYSFGVIHHSPNPKKIIEQLSYYLKPEGELRMMVYSAVSYKAFAVMHYSNKWHIPTMRDAIRLESEAQYGSPVTFVYTFDEVKQLLQPYFTVQKIWKDHIFTWDVDQYKQGIFKRADAFVDITEDELSTLASELGWHTMCIATLN
ncbi:MAG TPA: class I SAM-dependent methyltransferase [Candidatus Saccharimonadales bacterium]|nr:class I SAM-dependent methyltransferase [Candidatus Saccharimonadales bacterium]